VNIERDVIEWLHHRHHDPGAPQQDAPAMPHNGTQEEHMSIASDARQAFETAVSFYERHSGNPVLLSLEGLGLTELHLSPAEVQAVTGIISSLEASHAAPVPSFLPAPAGPQVGGQA